MIWVSPSNKKMGWVQQEEKDRIEKINAKQDYAISNPSNLVNANIIGGSESPVISMFVSSLNPIETFKNENCIKKDSDAQLITSLTNNTSGCTFVNSSSSFL